MMTPVRTRFKKFFAFILLSGAVPLLFLPSEAICDSCYIAVIPIISAFVIILGSDRSFSRSISVWISSAILTTLFLAMLSITELLSSSIFSARQLAEYVSSEELCSFLTVWNRAVFLPALILSLLIVFQKLLSFVLRAHTGDDSDMDSWIKWCTAVFVAGTFICLFSTFPGGYMQDDVTAVWRNITTGRLNDWHTIGFELFCRQCSLIYRSPFTVNVVQSILWILLNYKILKTFAKMSLPKQALLCYTALNVLIFTPFLYLQVMMKDIIFGISLTAFTLMILVIIENSAAVWDYLICILSGLGVILFRHAQMIPVVITFFVCFIYLIIRRKRGTLIRLFFSFAAILVLYTAIVPVYAFDHLEAKKNPEYVTYSTPLAMIGNALSNDIEFSEHDTQILEQLMPVEEYVECYNKYYIDDISRSWGKLGVDRCYQFQQLVEEKDFGTELLRMNAELALSHPVIYISGLLDASSIIWEIGRPADSITEWGLHSLKETSDKIHYSALYPVTHSLNLFMAKTPVIRSLCCRGGIWLFALIFSATVLILKRRRQSLLAMLPVIIISLLLLLTTPAQHTRYIIPTMECAFLFLAYSIYSGKRERL